MLGWLHILRLRRDDVRNALLMNLAVFGALFSFHIVAAAMDWRLVFSLVAGAISLHVLLFGPVAVMMEASPTREGRKATNRAGFFVSFPLALGLAWAYGGMAWSFGPVGWILSMHIIVHGLAELRFRPPSPHSEMDAVGGLK